jgi:hypothetical protein
MPFAAKNAVCRKISFESRERSDAADGDPADDPLRDSNRGD